MMEIAASAKDSLVAPARVWNARRRAIPRQSPPSLQDVRYAACEIRAVFDDGHEEGGIVRRASARRSIRQYEARPGIASVAIVRRLNLEEYEAERARAERPIGDYVVPEAVPEARPALATAEAPSESDPYAWEVLVRQHGKTRTVRVACSTEDGSVELMRALDGVDAAVAIRPLSLEEYRRAVR